MTGNPNSRWPRLRWLTDHPIYKLVGPVIAVLSITHVLYLSPLFERLSDMGTSFYSPDTTTYYSPDTMWVATGYQDFYPAPKRAKDK